MSRLSVIRSGQSLAVYLLGNTFNLSFDTREETVEMYKEILAVKATKDEAQYKALAEKLSPSYKLAMTGSVTRDRNGNYYLGNTNTPIPFEMATLVKESIEDELPIDHLENFWKLLLLNPDKHVRESLFQFANRFKMPITDNGYFIAYKSVAWKGEKDKALGVFTSQMFIKYKAAGKSTDGLMVYNLGNDQYVVYTPEEAEEYFKSLFDEEKILALKQQSAIKFVEEKDFLLFKGVERQMRRDAEEAIEIATKSGWAVTEEELIEAYKASEDYTVEEIGTLDSCFARLDELFDYDEPTFTDWHTKKSTIKLGEAVQMPREECDNNPSNTCSSGLHVGAPGYVSKFGGSDSYILACLVNPMNVVAVPYDYDFEKMRTCEYLPYAICEFKDDKITEVDTQYFEEDYINYEKAQIESMLEELNQSEVRPDHEDVESLMRKRLVDLSN